MLPEHCDRPRQSFADYAEGWAAGFCAARDDVALGDDPDRFMRQLAYDWRMSGSELAQRAVAGELDDEDRAKIEHLRRYG